MAYQPFGNLLLEFGHAEAKEYRRSLDLDSAVARALTNLNTPEELARVEAEFKRSGR